MPRLLIGVVGPTKHASDDALGFAADLGRGIVEASDFPLTGGHHRGPDRHVKNVVLRAAVKADGDVHGLGILPDAPVPARDLHDPQGLRYVATGMGSRRNALTGGLPDVLIALRGGPGTLSEICFAQLFHVPVVFLGWSTEQFDADITTNLNEARDYVNLPTELNVFGRVIDKDSVAEWLRAARRTIAIHFTSAEGALAEARQASPRPHREVLTVLATSTPEWQRIGKEIEDALQELPR